ncbi:unnamed protein product, partial [Cuscuta epithymum]
MEAALSCLLLAVGFWALVLTRGVLDWVWLKPKRWERCLKEQGLKGNPYRLLFGDMKDMANMISEANSKPMNLFDDYTAPRLLPYFLHLINKYGKNCYVWMGPTPTVVIMDTDLIKEVFNKHHLYQKSRSNPLTKKLMQ